jgi:GNAT superfamily N-acetyltransferase
MTTMVREVRTSDYKLLAALHNATHEPHFHVTTAELANRDAHPSDELRGRLVAIIDAHAVGMATFGVQEFDRPDRVWLDLAIHPDHTRDDTAQRLVDAVIEHAQRANIASLWMPIREDYLDAWPDPLGLQFQEVHRTFGGGFFIAESPDVSQHSMIPLQLRSLAQAREVETASARALYGMVRTDKVTAEPTITAAAIELDLDDAIAASSFLAFDGDELVGMCIVERSSLGAWLSVIAVRPQQRRQGVARHVLAASLTALREQSIAFLNTAGVRSDEAYLGLVRSLGATIEPDWISYERVI